MKYFTPNFLFLICSAYVSFGQDSLSQNIQTCINIPDTYNSQAVYRTVDKMPQFLGGESEFIKYIAKNIVYYDKEKIINSVIHATFIIDTLGQVQNPCIFRIPNQEYSTFDEQQVIDLLSHSPLWSIGKLDNKKVCVRLALPVRICLK